MFSNCAKTIEHDKLCRAKNEKGFIFRDKAYAGKTRQEIQFTLRRKACRQAKAKPSQGLRRSGNPPLRVPLVYVNFLF